MTPSPRRLLRDQLRSIGGTAGLIADLVEDDLDAAAFEAVVPLVVRALKLEIYGPTVRSEGTGPRTTDDAARSAAGDAPNEDRHAPPR